MKKFRLAMLSLVCAVVLVVSSCAAPESASVDAGRTVASPYEYPVTPEKTEEWKTLSIDERRAAGQIPEEILSELTNGALVETILNYPLSADFYAFGDFETGYQAVKGRFNGLAELERRLPGEKKAIADLLKAAYEAVAAKKLVIDENSTPEEIREAAKGSLARSLHAKITG